MRSTTKPAIPGEDRRTDLDSAPPLKAAVLYSPGGRSCRGVSMKFEMIWLFE